MHQTQDGTSIYEASCVSAAYVTIGDVMPALGYTLANPLDAPFGVIQANVEEPGEE